jgi:hypothetical protein
MARLPKRQVREQPMGESQRGFFVAIYCVQYVVIRLPIGGPMEIYCTRCGRPPMLATALYCTRCRGVLARPSGRNPAWTVVKALGAGLVILAMGPIGWTFAMLYLLTARWGRRRPSDDAIDRLLN